MEELEFNPESEKTTRDIPEEITESPLEEPANEPVEASAEASAEGATEDPSEEADEPAKQSAKEHPVLFDMKLKWLLLFAFALPFVICLVVYIAAGYYPFGTKSVLVTDFWHQYFPMIREFRETLLEGGSLMWNWHSGLGSNVLPMMAYYFASPLNLLSVFVPEAHLRLFLTLLIFVRIGLCGLTAALFMAKVFRRTDVSVIFFSCLWALCACIMGYFWNLMWLDSIALMPVVMLGAIRLIRDKRPLCYTVSLALCLFCNYYIGLYVCIAVLFSAICITILTWQGLRAALRSFVRMLFHSVIAIGATAVLLLPAYLGMCNSYSIGNNTVGTALWNSNLLRFLSQVYPFREPNFVDLDTPNLSCGLISLLLFVIFLTGKRRIREKICVCGGLAFLMFSFLFRPLDFYWNGAHYTNMIPFRYSFLFSFLLVLAAYRAYCDLKETKLWQVILAGAITEVGAIFGYAYGHLEFNSALVCIVATVLYTLLLMMYQREALRGRVLACVLCFLICAEAATAGAFGVSRSSDHTSYLVDSDCIRTMLEKIPEEPFSRTEITTTYTLNDGMLYGYNGITQFSSSANYNVTGLMDKLGVGGNGASNRYAYYHSTPFIHSILGISHLISRNGSSLVDPTLQEIASEGYIKLYEYAYPLPVVFPVAGGADADLPANDPFRAQNILFSEMTGLTDSLFDVYSDAQAEAFEGTMTGSAGNYNYKMDEDSEGITLQFTVTCPRDGYYYFYSQFWESDTVYIRHQGSANHFANKYNQPSTLPAGYFEAGDTFEIRCTIDAEDATSGPANFRYAIVDMELFEEGYEILRDGTLIEESHSDTFIVGTVTAQEDCILYTSVPYENGWSVYLDGEQVDTKAYAGGFISCDLPAGEHKVELRYQTEGLIPGAVISALCILLIAASALFYRRKHRTDAIREPADAPALPDEAEPVCSDPSEMTEESESASSQTNPEEPTR